jgi:hypothetical protein
MEVSMNGGFQKRFIEKWDNYLAGTELPIGFYYSDKAEQKNLAKAPKGHGCLICELAKVRKGKTLCFNIDALGCSGAKRYLGFQEKLMPGFEYFLSCGIPGKMEGERYKKSPDLVKEHLKHHVPFKAPDKFIVFKRWDRFETEDEPLVVIFFAYPDVLSALFTLASFDEPEPNGVMAPFCAGCAAIVDYPYKELAAPRPRPVLGMFDVSARLCVSPVELSFAVPWPKFVRMVDDMDESFLITKSWNKVRTRIKRDLGGKTRPA